MSYFLPDKQKNKNWLASFFSSAILSSHIPIFLQQIYIKKYSEQYMYMKTKLYSLVINILQSISSFYHLVGALWGTYQKYFLDSFDIL